MATVLQKETDREIVNTKDNSYLVDLSWPLFATSMLSKKATITWR